MLLKRVAETSEHAASYYAASARDATAYPPLEGDIVVDVVVVGGGFSGVSTALELGERGFRVALLEANRIGWGASGRNGGQIISGLGHEPKKFLNDIGEDGVRALYRMGFEGVDIIRERIEKYAIECDLVWGYCDMALKPRHLREFEEFRQEMADRGSPYELKMLDRDEAREYVNSEVYCGGCYNEGWGHLQPLDLCVAEARAAERLGARIFEQTRVQDIVLGDSPRVRTERGGVRADTVILCGNAYLGDLVPQLDAKVLPATSCIIATAPLSGEQIQATMRRNVAVCDPRSALDYYRLSADKRLLFGGLANYTGLEPSDLIGTLRRKMLHVFPVLREVEIDYGWSGQMGICVRRIPQMGRLNGNVLYVQAYSGHGVAPTHIMGRVLAEAVAGDTRRFELMASIKHSPWPGGKLLRRSVMALGMAYHKLKDALW